MRWFGVVFFVFFTGCSAITGSIQDRWGAEAANVAQRSLSAAVSAGPTAAVTGGISGDRVDATVALGYYGVALGERRLALPGGYRGDDLPSLAKSDFALVLGAEGGWQFRREAGFLAFAFGGGWRSFTGGMRLTGAYDGDDFGFAMGPHVAWHLRLDTGPRQPELQMFAHAELFVANHDRYAHQVLGGARVLWDLY